MTTSTTLIQRAAELVIAFGLEHSPITAAGVRAMAHEGTISVLWYPPSDRSRRPVVELIVVRCTDSIFARVSVEASGVTAGEAKLVAALYTRVVELAERIEALR